MARNVELKARCHNLEALRKLVVSLGAAALEVLPQTDTFFNVSPGRLKLRESGDDSGELICYERPNAAGPKLSNYRRVPVSEPGRLRQILAEALGVRATVRKRREVLILGQTRIHLDDVETLGTFVEFEVVLRDDQSISEGREIVSQLISDLSIKTTDFVADAYADLIVQRQ